MDNYYPSNIDNPLSTKLGKKKLTQRFNHWPTLVKPSDYKTIFPNHYMFTVCQ